MKKKTILWTVGHLFLILVCTKSIAAPCDGINRKLDQKTKEAFEVAIAAQLKTSIPNVSSVEILQVFSFAGWTVAYINTRASDEAFLIYKGTPSTSKYLDLWAGAYAADEEQRVYQQLVSGKSKGVPDKLARCLAWHITKDRD